MIRNLIVFAVVFSIFISQEGYAQPKEKVKFGIKGGLNWSLMKGENYFSSRFDYDPRFPKDLMYYGGLLIDVPVVKHFGVQAEAIYSKSGYLWYKYHPKKWTFNSHEPAEQESLTFISVPLLLKFKLKGLAIYGGPQIDFLLSATRKHIGKIVSNEDLTKPADAKKEYKTGNTYSLIAGAEYTFRFGLGLSLRYQTGLTSLAQATETGLYEQGNEIKNQLVMFGPYFKFGKSRKK